MSKTPVLNFGCSAGILPANAAKMAALRRHYINLNHTFVAGRFARL